MKYKRKFSLIVAMLCICTLPSLWASGKNMSTQNSAVPEQQKTTLSGKVTDKNGSSLIGVSIRIKGEKDGTITDLNGNFTLNNVAPSSVLICSYIGMNTQEVTVQNQSFIKIVMEETSEDLNELVVVGYGTQRKSDITGSVTSVSKDRFSKIPTTNVMHAIEGAVAGINITNTSSVPGSDPKIQVRGINSINANTSPLIIVDGIPFEGSLNNISSNDIASLEILKDASSVAIYGTRGSNGVILITTKKGTSGKPQISYSAYSGVENMAHILAPRNGAQYVQKYADYMKQTNQTQTNPVPNLAEISNYNAGNETNWINEVSQQGIIQNHNLSINGGSESMKYYVSGDYLNQKGVIKGYNYKKYGIRSGIETDITDYLTTGLTLFLVSNNYNGGRANLLNATAMSPYGQLMNETTGKYQIYPMYPEILYSNPLIGLYNENIDERVNINGNFFAELKPKFIPGLKYRLNASYNYNPIHTASYTGRDGNDLSGTASVKNSQSTLWVIENILTYTKDIEKHHFDFTGLYSAQKNDYWSNGASGVGFVNDLLIYNNMSAASKQTANSYASSYAMISQMGRLNYSYDNKYLVTATARRDGYSAFGSNTDKYGLFPSVALGWNMANENFMAFTKNVLDLLKLRASYGLSGNMAIGVNQTTTIDKVVPYTFDGASNITIVADILGNKNLHWETTKGFNFGLDFSLFNSRINGTVEAYNTRTKDLLLRRNLPIITGYSNVWSNIGEVGNTGLDVTLKTVNIDSKDFKWSSNINFSTFSNKIIDLYGDKKDDIGNKWFIGKSLGAIYDYKMVGVWQTDDADLAAFNAKAGDLKFADLSGVNGTPDGKIDSYDKVYQGSTLPKWIGGITNTFEYKNFNLSIFIQTSQGSLKNNPDLTYADETGRRNTPAEVGYWTSENKSNTRPALNYNNTLGYGYPSDNSYTRIKDVTLSYVFSNSLLSKTFIKDLTLYVSGRNLYTFTDWIGWDPEDNYSTRGSGSWAVNYPSVRSYVVGLNISLK